MHSLVEVCSNLPYTALKGSTHVCNGCMVLVQAIDISLCLQDYEYDENVPP